MGFERLYLLRVGSLVCRLPYFAFSFGGAVNFRCLLPGLVVSLCSAARMTASSVGFGELYPPSPCVPLAFPKLAIRVQIVIPKITNVTVESDISDPAIELLRTTTCRASSYLNTVAGDSSIAAIAKRRIGSMNCAAPSRLGRAHNAFAILPVLTVVLAESGESANGIAT